MVLGDSERHNVYHNFSIWAPICVVRLMETRFPAESMVKPIHGKASNDMSVCVKE